MRTNIDNSMNNPLNNSEKSNTQVNTNYQAQVREIKGKGYLVIYDGSYELISIPLALVLSGGGAKGYAYAGMILALNAISLDGKRTILEGLTHISGASAGAMTASLLAISMPAEEIATLITQLDVSDAMDPESGHKRGKGDCFRNLLEVIYWFQIKRILEEERIGLNEDEFLRKYGSISEKIVRYTNAFKNMDINIQEVNDFIKLSKNENLLAKLNSFFAEESFRKGSKYEKPTADNPWITFSDLDQIKTNLPENKQYLIKELHLVTTNQEKLSLATHNKTETPHQSIAQQVLNSCAHPALFHRQDEIVTNSDGSEEVHRKRDGGIINNFPIQPLLDAGIPLSQILGTTLNPLKKYLRKLNALEDYNLAGLTPITRLLDKVLSSVVGGNVIEGRQVAAENQKILYWFDSLIPINSEELSTLDLGATMAQKEKAIDSAKKTTETSMQLRKKRFKDPLELFLNIDNEQLDEICEKLCTLFENGDLEKALVLTEALATAKLIYAYQQQIIKELEAGQVKEVTAHIVTIEKLIDGYFKDNEVQKTKVLGFCFNQIEFLSYGKLTKFLAQHKPEIKAKVEQKINFCKTHRENEKHQIKDFEQFITKVSEALVTQLSFKHVMTQMLSETLKTKIKLEAEAILSEILPTLSLTQTAVLMANFNQLVSELAGYHKENANTGLTQIYCECLQERRKRDRWFGSAPEGQERTRKRDIFKPLPQVMDELTQSKEYRSERTKALLSEILKTYATPEQRQQLLAEESKQNESKAECEKGPGF